MTLNLQENVRQWVLKNLPYDHMDIALDTYLKGLNAHGLLVVYHNWTSRLIRPNPRRVHISNTLNTFLSSSVHRAAIEEIIDKIATGQDLNCFLSKGIQHVADVPRNDKKFNKRRDLDLLLLDWGLHHLHLSTAVMPDGFVQRTDDLLFAVFKPDDAYLVDVMPHGSWNSEHLVKVMFKELGGAATVYEMKGCVGLSFEPTEDERKKLRNAAVNSPLMIDGKAVIALGGMSAAATSINATRAADRLLIAVADFEDRWANNRSKFLNECERNGVLLDPSPEFAFEISPSNGAGILERKTGAFFKLS